MPTTVRFVERPGWQYRVLSEAQAQATVKRVADELAKAIVSNVPIRTGQYQAYFESGLSDVGARGEMATAAQRVTTDSSLWHIIEFGSVNNPPYAPMRRGTDQLGLEWVGR